MAKVDIVSVEVLNNPAKFKEQFKFCIKFECTEALEDDLEWKLVYVSSAYDDKLDQTLDNILVGPVPVGLHQFVFEAKCPDTDLIPPEDALGVTVVLLQALYHDKEFIRAGYYINNEYSSEEMRENPPITPDFDQMNRNILASDPRITRFPIDWGDGIMGDEPVPFVDEVDVDNDLMEEDENDEQFADENESGAYECDDVDNETVNESEAAKENSCPLPMETVDLKSEPDIQERQAVTSEPV